MEGLTYDAQTDTLYAVREDKPPLVFRIHPLTSVPDTNVEVWPLELDGLDDLSDLFFDSSTGWLWLLSDESRRAAAFDDQGRRVAERRLKQGHLGLLENIKKAEGITRDRHGRWRICSEPNQIYCFV